MRQYAQDIRDWFISFADSFSSQDPRVRHNLALKKDHTLRVCAEITSIGTSLGLDEEDLRTAQITALMHDVGRFDQYARYKTFSDRLSVNHAELGVTIMKKTGVLRSLSEEEKNAVFEAVLCHNLPYLPDTLTERTALFARLIRDADKLDILHILAAHYRNPGDNAIELALPNLPELSKKAVADAYAGKIVNFADIHCSDDFKIAQMAWIFDLNCSYSLRQFHERGHLNSLKAALPDNKIARDLCDFLEKRLMERMETVS